jgi:ethylbenzene dioxygenase alpha subunit
MGLGRAGPHPVYPGLVSERYISENNQRLFYRRWEEFMNAESWDDIRLEPVAARFDGTATMQG